MHVTGLKAARGDPLHCSNNEHWHPKAPTAHGNTRQKPQEHRKGSPGSFLKEKYGGKGALGVMEELARGAAGEGGSEKALWGQTVEGKASPVLSSPPYQSLHGDQQLTATHLHTPKRSPIRRFWLCASQAEAKPPLTLRSSTSSLHRGWRLLIHSLPRVPQSGSRSTPRAGQTEVKNEQASHSQVFLILSSPALS